MRMNSSNLRKAFNSVWHKETLKNTISSYYIININNDILTQKLSSRKHDTEIAVHTVDMTEFSGMAPQREGLFIHVVNISDKLPKKH